MIISSNLVQNIINEFQGQHNSRSVAILIWNMHLDDEQRREIQNKLSNGRKLGCMAAAEKAVAEFTEQINALDISNLPKSE